MTTPRSRGPASTLGLLLFLLSTLPAQAANFCVNTTAEFQQALDSAKDNGEPDYLSLAGGTYPFNLDIEVQLEALDVTIDGGFNGDCSDVGPATVFTGGMGQAGRLDLSFLGGRVLVQRIAFQDVFSSSNTEPPLAFSNHGGTLRVNRISVLDSDAYTGVPVLDLYSDAALRFTNSLVARNYGVAAVRVRAYGDREVVVANNTIANNVAIPQTPGLVLDLDSDHAPAIVANNIVWGHTGGTDIDFGTSQQILFRSNTFGMLGGTADFAPASGDSSNADPLLNPVTLLPGSPAALNSGLPLPMILGALDLSGNLRTQGSAPDRGAYETPTLDQSLYQVTSTGDAGPGTLRAAIAAANTAGVPARVTFALPGGCAPHVIELQSPLPGIQVPLEIDGFSQAGAMPSESNLAYVFNASICVILYGGIDATSRALSVAAGAPARARLTVRGLAFSGFGHSAINLAGGVGHWVYGNTFGVPITSTGPLVRNYNNIVLGGSASASLVGGGANAHINLIGKAGGLGLIQPVGVGVWVTDTAQGNKILYNFIGTTASTSVAAGNSGEGIRIDSDFNTVRMNLIGGSGRDGILLNGAEHTVVEANRLGSDGNPALDNAGAGIHFTAGAARNQIGGSYPDFAEANGIGPSGKAGVWVDETAGPYNQVIGNSISPSRGSGLPIDLQALGVTPNETLPASRNAKKPALGAAVRNVGNTVQLSGTLAADPADVGGHVVLSVYGVIGGCLAPSRYDFYLRSQLIEVVATSQPFSIAVEVPDHLVDQVEGVAATASSYTALQETSEHSGCLAVTGTAAERLFANGFE
jgi:hypothetical protein